jgi:lipid-binding SYLF domain-containing protein
MKHSRKKFAIYAVCIVLLLPLTAVAAPQDQPQITRERAQFDQQSAEQRGNQDRLSGTTTDLDAINEATQTVDAASALLTEIFNQARQQIPSSELQNAAAVAIVPNLVRAGLIVGGRHGTGVLVARNQDQWSPPVFISITGGSLGAQLGVESSDLILVFGNSDVLEEMLQDNDFTLGVDASVAAGSAGAKAEATTRGADVLTYQRTEGLFAGIALTGAVLNIDEDRTMAYYGLDEQTARGYYSDRAQMAKAILGVQVPTDSGAAPGAGGRPGIEQIPPNAQELQETLNQYASQ